MNHLKHAFVLHVFACLTSIIQWYMSMFEEEIIADHPHRNHAHHEQSPCTAYRYRNWKLKSQATATCPQVFGTSIEFWCFQAFWIPFGELIEWCWCWFNRFRQNGCLKSTHFRKHFLCCRRRLLPVVSHVFSGVMGNEPCKCLKDGDADQEVKVTALPVVGDASMDAEDRIVLLLFWWN